jgi:hypothetical protein
MTNDYLYNALNGFMATMSREPAVIILHPQGWYKLLRSNQPASYNLSEPKWNGIKVIRSTDIKEDEVEIY